MNKAFLIGRLTKDATTTYTQDGKAISKFTLAVNRYNDTTDFITCIAFDKKGEFFEKYGKKGTKFAICGRVQTGSYTNRDGQKVYTTDIVVEDVEFCENKASEGSKPPTKETKTDDFMSIPEGFGEELPFA